MPPEMDPQPIRKKARKAAASPPELTPEANLLGQTVKREFSSTETHESIEDRDRRLRKEAREETHAIWRESITLILVGVLILAAFAVCVGVILLPSHYPDTVWARTLLNTIISGTLGYALRGRAK